MLLARDLALRFGSRELFSHINFELKSNELLWIKGKNGSGKSSLLKICAGLINPTFGLIKTHFDDGLAFLDAEHLGLFHDLSAAQNLRFWANLKHLKSVDLELIYDELKFWHLPAKHVLKDLSVKHYSTGMKKRLSLARMRLNGAKVWLMDEPTFGLDVQGLSLLEEAIEEHLKKGGCLALVCHDQHFLKHQTYSELHMDSY